MTVRFILLVARASCALLVTSVSSFASPSGDALDYVKDAIVAVDERGGHCKRDVFDDLLAIRDLLRDGADAKASSQIRELRHNADRCPERVDRALRRAADALEDVHDRRRDRVEDRARARPKRPAGVPYADWYQGCLEHWIATDLARGRLSAAALHTFATTFDPICRGNTIDEAYYPNGTMAKSRSHDFYYPNGTKARSKDAEFYYPNGTKARSRDGNWYYPNGTMAWSSSRATWYYRTGTRAGSASVLAAWAKDRVTPAQLAQYQLAMKSDVDAWRGYALLRLATQARN